MNTQAVDNKLLPDDEQAPIVSVLVLTYNHEPYIRQALDSILAQVVDFPFEILVGEDCSTDGTRAIVEGYSARYPSHLHLFSHQRNLGMHANHAFLLRQARGTYVAYCEGDDFWTDPNKLQMQIDWLDRNPQAGAVHTDFDHVIDGGSRTRSLRQYQRHRFKDASVPSGKILDRLLLGNFVQTCTLCVRRHLSDRFLESASKESYPVGDWPLCLYIAAHSEIGYLDTVTAGYRKVRGSMMNSGHVARARTVSAFAPMVEDFCSAYAVTEATRMQALENIYKPLCSLAVLADDVPLFRTAWAWLQDHDSPYLRTWRSRLLRRMADHKSLRGALRAVQGVRTWAHEWLNYS